VGQNGLDNTLEDNDTATAVILYTLPSTDSDVHLNYLDIDSDNDGIVDNIEAQASDSYDYPSTNPDAKGMVYDSGLLPVDTEGDGIPDYMDDNADNDIRPDVLEGWDTDSNGTAEILPSGGDTDQDGLDNSFDANDSAVNPTNSQIPQSFPNAENPATPELDWREVYGLRVVVNNDQVVEGNTLVFTFSLEDRNGHPITASNAPTSASQTDINIEVYTSDGTPTGLPGEMAVAPYDYTPVPAPTTLTIPAGDVSVSIQVSTYDDIIYENDEFLTLNGQITSSNTINTDVPATGTILDNEDPPALSLTDDEVEEGAVLQHTFTLSHPTSTPVNIIVNTQDNTATAPDDYTPVNAAVVIEGTLDENSPNLEVIQDIPTIADNVDEPDEEYLQVSGQVTTGNVQNAFITATGTILDLQPPPILSINDPVVVEGETLLFAVTLTNASYRNIDIQVDTENITAVFPGDYSALSYTGFIPAYSEYVEISVPTHDDKLNEETETMLLKLEVLSDNTQNDFISGTGTIKDNDLPNLFSPNRDGMSDNFVIDGLEDFPDFRLQIFDRWGSRVFVYENKGSLSPQWWDGTHNGKPVPEGVYYYVLEYNDGRTEPHTGFVELIR
jgi:gliding motility-associated-like protein